MLQAQTTATSGKDSPVGSKSFLIALGGNQKSAAGDPAKTLLYALNLLEKSGATVCALSRFYRTSAFPAGSGPDYVNAAAHIVADWPVAAILPRLHRIEAELGRERDLRWGPRTLDLDLLAVGDTIFPDTATHAVWRNLTLDEQTVETPDDLILPHPRMQDRAFVLVPLADIAPDWRHPILGRSVREMLAALPPDDIADVRALE